MRSVRRHSLADAGFFHQVVALVRPQLKLHVVDFHGAIAEDGLLLRAFPRASSRRSRVRTLVLQGVARATARDAVHWLAPGDVLDVPNRDGLVMRLDGTAGYVAVVIEWEDACGEGPIRVGQASRVEVAEAQRLATRLSAGCESAERLLQRATALFGIPVVPEEQAPALTPWTGVSQALDHALSGLSHSAGLSDVARRLEVSERHARRLVEQMQRTYGLNTSGSWQDALLRRRVMMAAVALTNPRARVGEVAHSVGYASAASLCRAFEGLGLPSPGRVRTACHALA
ncbi:MAG: hypothetical protein R3B07_04725 [Polyangiaceae bacterium]